MKTTDFLNENFIADATEAHQDHEVQMARSDCYNAAKYAIELHKLLKHISEQQGLDGWVSEKITLANDYLRTVTEYLRYEQQSSSSGMPEFDVGSATQTLDAALGESVVQEDEYDDAVNAFLTKNKPIVGKTHKPRKAERLGGSKHIGTLGGSGASKGRVSGLSANTGAKTKPVVTAEDNEEPQTKRQPAVVKTNKPIGTRVADIGPGGKEYNVKTNKAWDDQHKQEPGVAEGSTWYAGNGAIKEKIAKYEELALKANREGDDAKTKMYQQKIQTLKQKMSHMEESAGGMGAGSVAISMGGGNGFANGGPGTISRTKMKKKK